jgi:c-di-GMP-binding flagellar brake protein YcgR/type II secretory pathway pseudopilin PulG
MNTVASGFQTPPIEIVAVFVLIATMIAGFLLYYLGKQRAQRRRHAREDAQRYHQLAHQYSLTPTDESVISQLATYLQHSTGKHVLLHSQDVFNQAAALALEDDQVGSEQISSLRVKLGYTGRPIGMRPRSSVDIPAGSAILIETRRHTAIHGTVVDVASGALRVRLDAEDIPLAEGKPIHVVYQNEAGVFEFDSAVLLRNGIEVQIQHSEEIKTVQQRNHYRRELRLPVYVGNALSSDEPELSRFIDIGGGGASLENPGKRFNTGDTVELTFHPEGDTTLNLIATVVRTSHGGSTIHVKYGNIRESSRDRVYRLLFASQDS